MRLLYRATCTMAEVPLPTPTQVPVPSTDIRNAVFAGAKLDEEVTGTGDFYIDRLGVKRLTNTGRNNQFQQFLLSSGYVFLGDYEDGPFQFNARNQYIRYNNQYYRLNSTTDVGFTTTGIDASSFANDILHFVLMDGDTLRQHLMASDGQLLIGAPDTIESLRNIAPLVSARIQTKGAFAAYDMGHGDWIYDTSDMSAFVTQYPRLFIAPNIDLTGASGAWRLNLGNDIPTRSYGVGLTSDPNINSEILNQVFKYNNGKRWVVLPPFSIWLSSVEIRGTDPKVKGTPGATAGINGGNGTAIITRDSFSSADVFKVTSSSDSSSNRVTGCFVKDIKIVSYDFFNTPGYDTFSTRTNRRAFSFNYCGAQLDISGLVAIGFKQGMYCNELWDGSLSNIRLMYCSDSAGAGITPAFYMGSAGTDNSNNISVNHLHIEFSPYAMNLGFVEHCRFKDLKCESWRNLDATNNVVRIEASATKNVFDGALFSTQNSTLTHFMYNAGQFITFNDPNFAAGESSLYPYTGVKWYYGAAPTNSRCVFKDAHFNRCNPGDGTNADDYPIVLGNYSKFSGTIRTSTTYQTSSGSVTNTRSGLVALGTSCMVDALHLIVGTTEKTSGPVIYFKGTGSVVDDVSQTANDAIYSLATGNADNEIRSYGSPFLRTSNSVISAYGKNTIILTAATAVTQILGLTGQKITIWSDVSGSSLTNNASLVTDSGANISMTTGKPFEFVLQSGAKCRQIV